VVLVVSNEVFRIDGKKVNKKLDALWQEPIGVLQVVKLVRKHPRLFNQPRNLACVYVNNVPGVVHYVVSEYCANVIRNLGKQVPNRLLGLVLPFLVLDVIPKKVSESELVGKRKVCLVKFLK
jgi:hypothetical protein